MLKRSSSSFSMRPAIWAEKRSARTKAFIAARHCTALCFGCARARGMHTPASDLIDLDSGELFFPHTVFVFMSALSEGHGGPLR